MLASVTDITPDLLHKRAISALLVDMDETLLASTENNVRPAFKSWVRSLLEANMRVSLLSNGTQQRVSTLANSLGIGGLALAGKPFSLAFRRGLNSLGTNPGETAMVGDQLFTDIAGANLAGLTSILVKPLSSGGLPHTRVLRKVEACLLNHLKLMEGGIHGRSLDR